MLAALPGLICVVGCAPAPRALNPVLANQALITQRLALAQSQDGAMLRAVTVALLDIRASILLGEAHRDLLRRGYLTPLLEPDAGALDRDLADPNSDSPLVREIRDGALTRDQAADWLNDYALSLRMSDGQAVQRALLSRRAQIRDFQAASGALLQALDARLGGTQSLLADLHASNEALGHYAAFVPTFQTPVAEGLRESLSALIAAHIDDPGHRALALELLDTLLLPNSPVSPLTLAPTE
jgi:hypothetical protein